jgi:hypothetical protein
VGREDSAPKSFVVADAEAISLAEGSIWATAIARLPGVAFQSQEQDWFHLE